MRSSTHRLKCADCPARIELTMEDLQFCDEAKRYVDAIAERQKWQVTPERVACRMHRTTPISTATAEPKP